MSYELGLQVTLAVCLWVIFDLVPARGAWSRRLPVIGFAASLGLWCLGSIMYEGAETAGQVLAARRVLFIGTTQVPLFLLWMAAEAARASWLERRPWIVALLALPLVVAYSCFWWDTQGGWYMDWYTVPARRGPLFWMHAGLAWLYGGAATAYFVVAAHRLGRANPLRIAAIALGCLVPLIGNVLFLLFQLSDVDPLPILAGVGFVAIRLAIVDSGIATFLPLSQRGVLEQLRTGVVVADLEGIVVDANQAALRLLRVRDLEGARLEPLLEHARAEEDRVIGLETVPLRRGGSEVGTVALLTDRSEEARLERQLGQAQKLESLGILAGGVAHDFKNLLTAILNGVSLARRQLPEEHPARGDLDRVVRASRVANHFTGQLLSYAGPSNLKKRTIDLSAEVAAVQDLLSESVVEAMAGTRVQVSLDLDPALPAVEADPTSIQQVLINLVLNAAKASEQGGRVRVRTTAAALEASDLARFTTGHALAPGPHAVLEVQDWGCGIDPAAQPQIFDPFFTTRSGGHGLGLAASLGIVHAHAGGIEVRSRVGDGTRFRIAFPPSKTPAAVAEPAREETLDPSGEGSVLAVDDDPFVLDGVRLALGRFGYSVCATRSGAEAVEALRQRFDRIQLAILDVNMPGMSGPETFEALRALRPDLKVLWSTTRVEGLPGADGSDPGIGFLAKPYEPETLAHRVGAMLRGESGPGPVPDAPEATPSAGDDAQGTQPDPDADPLEALRARFGAQLDERLAELAEALAGARARPDDLEAAEPARKLAHRLFGTAGSYGFDRVSELAGRIEDAILERREGRCREVPWVELARELEACREEAGARS